MSDQKGSMGLLTRRDVVRIGGIAGGGLLAMGGFGGLRGVLAQDATPAAWAAPDLSGTEVNLYSSRHYDTDQALYDGFAAATGATVNLIEAEADQLIERIKSEGENSPADILMTVDAGRLWRAQSEDVLQPISSPVLESAIPANLRDPDGHWFGFSQRIRLFAYSTERVDPATLSTYEALADPAWAGKILVRSSSNVYNQSLVGALIEALGEEATEEWARGLVANFARPPQGGDTDQIKAVAAGEGDVAITNHYYYFRLLNSDDPADQDVAAKTALFIPNQGEGERGVHANISGAGVVATAPNAAGATAFLEYLTTPDAQAVFAQGNYEMPVVPGAPSDPSLDSLGEFVTDPVDASKFGANNQAALLLMLRAGWE